MRAICPTDTTRSCRTTVPRPIEFLEPRDPLTDAVHVAVHRLTRNRFEDRKVYDTASDYNLARPNLDT